MEDARMPEKVFDETEVWEAIRGCGGDKAPGPDGFNFKGCNSSFVTIISKVMDPIGLGDFRPISLIGVNEGDMSDIARWMRCDIGEFPFTYLRLPIGENMGRTSFGVGRGTRTRSLNIGSLRAKNLALLGDVRAMGEVGVAGCGVWGDNVKIGKETDGLGVEFTSSCFRVLGDGKDIRLIEEKILLSDNGDRETLWNKLVPKKVNIFIWRALRGRLSVRVELDRRGMDLDSVLCPSCNDVVETCAHCLINCDLAMGVWDKIFDWWKFCYVASAASDFRFPVFVSAASDMRVPGSASSFSLQF
ncbi:RNA-directed DNA polymerase, eukaryota, reverse transcriptase zinc-binding domain protein [Tanacetum coccineum]